jgi:hypothetical protein
MELMHYANHMYVYIVIRVINYRGYRPATSRLAASADIFWLPGSGNLLLALSSAVIFRSRFLGSHGHSFMSHDFGGRAATRLS